MKLSTFQQHMCHLQSPGSGLVPSHPSTAMVPSFLLTSRCRQRSPLTLLRTKHITRHARRGYLQRVNITSEYSSSGVSVGETQSNPQTAEWIPDGRTWEERQHKVLGGEDFILSQASGVEELLFKGSVLGQNADIASGDLRYDEMRSLAHLDGDYYIPPRFLDEFAVHVAKNYLLEEISGKIPLILGIWGGKGCGKSFNVELCCQKMGLTPIIVSAGELEDPMAGEPGKRMRERYRRAQQAVQAEGKLACLVINDLDAGVGRFKNTSGMTVNNQMVQATLMNICDAPTVVSNGGIWTGRQAPRVPIIVTGNDLSRVYAPLIRDGRMAKFYWAPDRKDLVQMLLRIFKDDGLTEHECGEIVDIFPNQPLDFFGAMKSRIADNAVMGWVNNVGMEQVGSALYDSLRGSKAPPTIPGLPPVTLSSLLDAGHSLAQEQEWVMSQNLAREYMRWQEDIKVDPRDRVQKVTAAEMSPSLSERGREMVAAIETGPRALAPEELDAIEEQRLEEERKAVEAQEAEALWLVRDAERVKEILDDGTGLFVDIRSQREFNREAFKKAVSIPAVTAVGLSLETKFDPVPTFQNDFAKKFPDRQSTLILCSAGDDGYCEEVMQSLVQLGYTNLIQLGGGYIGWSKMYNPAGVRRQFGKWGTPGSQEHDYWTASN